MPARPTSPPRSSVVGAKPPRSIQAIIDSGTEAAAPVPKSPQTLKRTLSGIAGILLLLVGFHQGVGYHIIELAGLIFIIASLLEYARLMETSARDTTFGAATLIGAGALIWLSALRAPDMLPWTIVVGMMLCHGLNLAYGRISQYGSRVALMQLGLIHVALPLALLMQMAVVYQAAGVRVGLDRLGPNMLAYFFMIVWATDSGAYFMGRYKGKTPMAPRISPKKTMEGFFAGLAAAVLTAVVVPWWWPDLALSLRLGKVSYGWLAVVGLGVGLFGTLGDLAESAIKREIGVKDSGAFLPGHGGLLDRIDSILFGAPIFYIGMIRLIPPWDLAP